MGDLEAYCSRERVTLEEVLSMLTCMKMIETKARVVMSSKETIRLELQTTQVALKDSQHCLTKLE